jgi:serine/threonine protein kinase
MTGQTVFRRYTLKRVLGRGGMGIVWLAQDDKLAREVALKFVPDMLFLDPAARDDLKRETRRSLELTHPNIVRIQDFTEDEYTAAISMEYVDGMTLSQMRVQRSAKCFEPAEIEPWLCGLCAALDYAHGTVRMVHHDLKPANLMLNARGAIKVTDFGIACSLMNSVARVSMAASSGGTLVYMSPQQMQGAAPSHLDDIYALGATFYELLTGKPPFYSGDITLQVRESEPEPMCNRRRQFVLVQRK